MSYRMFDVARRLMCDKFSVLCTLAELNAKQAKEDNPKEDDLMNEKLAEIKAFLDKQLPIYEADEEEINDWKGDDFNPCDASGGNFDDAYFLGEEHGDTSGRLCVLREIRAIIGKGETE